VTIVISLCSACSAVHPSNWSFAKQALNASLAMSQQAFFATLTPQKFRRQFFSFSQDFTSWRLTSWLKVSSRFVWRGLASDITAWSRACLHCQQAKLHRHTRLQPQPVPILQRRFSHLHIDFVGPLQYSFGFNFIFTVIDQTSNWMEAVPLSDTSTEACSKALIFS
jgi:hypothetical protein